MELARRGAFLKHSRVLDLGCGIGDNALYLARWVTGLMLVSADAHL
jgi:cyclopropane fatty-acyl-phospholipid synthase-like methyltransferase